jgi:hypothetical protein
MADAAQTPLRPDDLILDHAFITTRLSSGPSFHRHLAAQKLISTLAHAIDAARGQAHDIVLPELPAAPVASVAPVKLLVRGRPPPSRRSRDG